MKKYLIIAHCLEYESLNTFMKINNQFLILEKLRNKLLYFFLLTGMMSILSAQKYDYVWPMGYQDDIPRGWGISAIDFNHKSIETKVLFARQELHLGYNGSFICNADGELQLMTEGCNILSHRGEIIENGDSINIGRFYNYYCKGTDNKYPIINSNFFISCPSWGDQYILIHQSARSDNNLQDVVCDHVYFSKIIKKPSGDYKVTQKNIRINHSDALITPIAGIEHASGESWWIFYHTYNSNQIHIVNIGVNGIIGRDSFNIGPIIYKTEYGISYQTKFSADGKTLLIPLMGYGLGLFDFDNVNGKLSNFRNLHTVDDSMFMRGICFSPNSRFIYYTQDTMLYQYDLDPSIDSMDRLHLIAHFFSQDETKWPYSMGCMHLGPDCRIYVSPTSNVKRMHVINQPNKKGLQCEFKTDAVILPTLMSYSVPNIMTFRSTAGRQLCDSTIQFVTQNQDIPDYLSPLLIYPSPVTDILHIELGGNVTEEMYLNIIDSYGNKITTQKINPQTNIIKVDTKNYLAGLYQIQISTKSKILSRAKFIKI